MKQLALLILAVTLSLSSSLAMSHGKDNGRKHYRSYDKYSSYHCRHKFCKKHNVDRKKDKPPVTEVPEIDANGTMMAFALLGGFLLIGRELYRSRSIRNI